MEKVAIMTINSINFGNRLQNYALQQVISSLGYKVETIRRTKERSCQDGAVLRLKKRLKEFKKNRAGCFLRFDRQFITFSQYHATPDEVEEGLAQAYNIFVAGSDQVWNPHYRHIVGDCDLLTFVRGKKKISYAASIGVDEIPADQRERYRRGWMDFDAISVREQAAAELVRKISGREAVVTLDPTLLLPLEQWKSIERKPGVIPKKQYAVVYSFGGMTDRMKDYITACRTDESLEIVDVFEKDKSGKMPAIGPSEFLYLIDHAERVITNSFHALVFSSLFHKPVSVFPRPGIDMSSRISTFAETVGLEERFSEDGVFALEEEQDFVQLFQRIREERIMSIDFLRDALKA